MITLKNDMYAIGMFKLNEEYTKSIEKYVCMYVLKWEIIENGSVFGFLNSRNRRSFIISSIPTRKTFRKIQKIFLKIPLSISRQKILRNCLEFATVKNFWLLAYKL